jgi:YfiH family protein
MATDTMIRLSGLDRINGVRHAFFTRRGGVSDGVYASLNCGYGSGDEIDRVERNRAAAMEMLAAPAERLVTCRQIHSARALIVSQPWSRDAAPAADGMASNSPGVVLGVLAADCAPVLLCDPAAGVVGAAHAGWRGALAGVVDATVMLMEQLGATRGRIHAGIGPSIGPASYEVGPEFPQPILAHDRAAAQFFAPAPHDGHFLFDLRGYIAHRLARLGVGEIEQAAHDTVTESDLFFSYRRARLRGEPAFGLGLSAITLAG